MNFSFFLGLCLINLLHAKYILVDLEDDKKTVIASSETDPKRAESEKQQCRYVDGISRTAESPWDTCNTCYCNKDGCVSGVCSKKLCLGGVKKAGQLCSLSGGFGANCPPFTSCRKQKDNCNNDVGRCKVL